MKEMINKYSNRIFFTILLMLFVSVTVSAQVAIPPAGSGTLGEPYLVASLENLYWITQNSGEWGKYYEQTADIDAVSTSSWDGGAGFTPIGNNFIKFTGTYDGKEHFINALYINRNTTNYIGLFGSTCSANIRNLGLTNVDINGGHMVGSLVGYTDCNSSISNCYATGDVGGVRSVGGLVGFNNESNIFDCYTTDTVNGDNYAIGGLVGDNWSSTISNCYATGGVVGNDYVGGLVGDNWSSTISNCFAAGDVVGNIYTGGLVALNSQSSISNCYATGDVAGSTYTAGLAVYNANSTISNCYATGGVVGNDYVGGLVSLNYGGNIINCYSIGTVTGVFRVGGLIGDMFEGSVTNSFWDIQTSGQAGSDGGTGKTTSEMKNIATFTDESTSGLDNAWDFVDNPNDDLNNEEIWNINASYSSGYSVLSWQLFIATDPVNEISLATATGNSTVFGSSTSRGFCWNTTGSPTTDDNKTEETGSWKNEYSFSASITGLSGEQIYYVKAYASNSMGTVYGNEVSFVTVPTLGQWGLIALGSITALLGGWFVYRRFV